MARMYSSNRKVTKRSTPCAAKRNELLPPTRQPRRRAIGIDELLGARLEYQHRGRRTQFGGARLEHADHLLVAQMHAIVIAHGQYAALMARARYCADRELVPWRKAVIILRFPAFQWPHYNKPCLGRGRPTD